MRNLKFVIFGAISGFVLSLFFGIFSHSGFLRVFLNALIFAALFAILGFAISVLYFKFLADEVSSSDGDYTDGESRKNTGSKASTGGIVDMVVQDEELEQTGNSNHYDVGSNHQMLNASDLEKNGDDSAAEKMARANASATNTAANIEAAILGETESSKGSDDFASGNFVPLRGRENYKNVSGTEAAATSDFQSSDSESSADLDVLPDLGDVTVTATGSDSSSDEGSSFEEVADDSNFVKSVSSDRKEPAAEIKDASLMAKAISSILSDEA